jgi:hypothetical protein
MQVWISNTLINSSRDSILTSAQKYWRNEGFYIELTGDYEDEYSDLIPVWIQD